jgi:hypothetical protein
VYNGAAAAFEPTFSDAGYASRPASAIVHRDLVSGPPHSILKANDIAVIRQVLQFFAPSRHAVSTRPHDDELPRLAEGWGRLSVDGTQIRRWPLGKALHCDPKQPYA